MRHLENNRQADTPCMLHCNLVQSNPLPRDMPSQAPPHPTPPLNHCSFVSYVKQRRRWRNNPAGTRQRAFFLCLTVGFLHPSLAAFFSIDLSTIGHPMKLTQRSTRHRFGLEYRLSWLGLLLHRFKLTCSQHQILSGVVWWTSHCTFRIRFLPKFLTEFSLKIEHACIFITWSTSQLLPSRSKRNTTLCKLHKVSKRLQVSNAKHKHSFYLSPFISALPCEQRFLSCMALSVYEVIRVAWQLRDWQATRTTS